MKVQVFGFQVGQIRVSKSLLHEFGTSAALPDSQPCAASAEKDLRDDAAVALLCETEQRWTILAFEVDSAFVQRLACFSSYRL
jgi:hypothetical protein